MNGNRSANTDGLFDAACRELRFHENKQPPQQLEIRQDRSINRDVSRCAGPNSPLKNVGWASCPSDFPQKNDGLEGHPTSRYDNSCRSPKHQWTYLGDSE